MCAFLGLNDITKEGRKAAWLLMLGIDLQSEEMKTHRELYEMFIREKARPKSKQAEIEHLIVKDVPRTFAGSKLFE